MKVSFPTPLEVSLTTDAAQSPSGRALWRLDAPMSAQVDGLLYTVPDGFETDFCSVPKVPFVYLLAGGIGAKAGVLHDWTYSREYDGPAIERARADDVLYAGLLACGVSTWRAWLMFRAVRMFGAEHWRVAFPPS